MNILAYFSNSGTPATGLTTPTIRIRDLSSGSLLVNDSTMTEVGDGFYSYDFTTYDKNKDYSIRCDGTAVLVDTDRYVYAGNENYIDDTVNGIWSEPLSGYSGIGTAGKVQQCDLYDNIVAYESGSGNSGTTFPVGTHSTPVDNLTDALSIMNIRNIAKLRIHNDLNVGSIHNISNLVIETIGKMGTSVTLTAGCSANKTTFRNVNLQGELSHTNEILVEDCQINSFNNFNGIMNNVIFGQGSEITFDIWAEIIQGTAGGEPTNEVEMDIGSSNLNISQWTGNLKLKGKNSTNRTVINCNSGNILIDSTCVSGNIQLLGIGQVEKDDSGTNCNVDIDAFISKFTISSAVWDEDLVNHTNDESTGHALMHEAYNGTIFVDCINGNNGSVYPFGIRQHPVKSISDILSLHNNYGLSNIHILGSLTISGGEDVSDFTFTSDRSIGNSLNIINAITSNTYVDNLTVTGTGNGKMRFTYCVIDGFSNLEGGIKNSLIIDNISYISNGNNYMTDCDRFMTGMNTYIDIDVSDSAFNMIRCRGNYNIIGKTSSNITTLDLNGVIKVDSTCVSGTIVVAGLTRIIDESSPNCFVLGANLTNDSISNSVWSEPISGYINSGTFGKLLSENQDYLKRIVGLVHENIFIDNPTFDSDGNMTSARLRIYSDPTDVGTSTNVIGTYNISAPGNGPGKFTNWSQIRIS